jgi:hypothetical protein
MIALVRDVVRQHFTAAGALQRAGLIRYMRGNVTLIDRRGPIKGRASAMALPGGSSIVCSAIKAIYFAEGWTACCHVSLQNGGHQLISAAGRKAKRMSDNGHLPCFDRQKGAASTSTAGGGARSLFIEFFRSRP